MIVATPSEAARLLGVSRQWVSQLIAKGSVDIAARTLTDKPLIDLKSLRRLLAERGDDIPVALERAIETDDAELYGAIDTGNVHGIAQMLYGRRT